MLRDARTGTKIAMGFAVAILMALLIGLVGRTGLNSTELGLRNIGENRLPAVHAVAQMETGQLKAAAAIRLLAIPKVTDNDLRQKQYLAYERGVAAMEAARRTYEALPNLPEEARVWRPYAEHFDKWQQTTRTFIALSKEKDELVAQGLKPDDSRLAELDTRMFKSIIDERESRHGIGAIVEELTRINQDASKNDFAFAMTSSSRSQSTILLTLLFGLSTTLLIAYAVGRNVRKNIETLVSESTRLSEAAVQGRLQERGDPLLVAPEFRGIVTGVNDTLDAVVGPLNVAADYVDRISKGNLPHKITDQYNGDFNAVKNNLNQCIEAIGRLVSDTASVVQATVEGRLDTRADPTTHQGDYRKILGGLNDAMDRVVGYIDAMPVPIMAVDRDLTVLYMNRLGAELGNATKDSVRGQKCYRHFRTNDCQTANCACQRTMASGVHSESDTVARPGGKELEINYRALPIKGIQGDVVGAVEVVLDMTDARRAAQIAKKLATYQDNEIAKVETVMRAMAQGQLDSSLTVSECDSDTKIARDMFERIAGAVAQVKASLGALVTDANALSLAAVEGKLATRADVSRHQGDFRRIVQGVNDTLDSVIGPLNVAADYVDRISKGNIPARITDSYNGDFNTIKNNLNRCIDAVNGLVMDAQALSQAAVEGRLATRADTNKHSGDFRKIVEGVNKTLDSVINPVMEATQVLEALSQYDLRVRVLGEYSGDHARIKTALNGTAKALHDALSQVADAVEQVADASRQIATSSQSVAQGASEQASSLEETSSSLEEMSGMTKQNADNTIQARALSHSTKEAAEKGGVAMTRMVDAMEKIRAASEGTSQIIKDINDIAFQTNLLALNAAVEAARAGDAGRGFAVVAEEVRSLALRSKEAAKKTEDLIKLSVGHAENGRTISAEVAGSLTEIVTAASKVNDIVNEIAVASQEQSRGIEQVNTAVSEMDKVVQVAAANAEESSSAAEELSSQSEELTGLVAQFQLDRESGRVGAKRNDPISTQRRRPSPNAPGRRPLVTAQPRARNNGTSATRKATLDDAAPFDGDPEFQDF